MFGYVFEKPRSTCLSSLSSSGLAPQPDRTTVPEAAVVLLFLSDLPRLVAAKTAATRTLHASTTKSRLALIAPPPETVAGSGDISHMVPREGTDLTAAALESSRAARSVPHRRGAARAPGADRRRERRPARRLDRHVDAGMRMAARQARGRSG